MSRSRELRNKVIGVLYITFIAIVFFSIPEAIIDQADDIKRSFDFSYRSSRSINDILVSELESAIAERGYRQEDLSRLSLVERKIQSDSLVYKMQDLIDGAVVKIEDVNSRFNNYLEEEVSSNYADYYRKTLPTEEFFSKEPNVYHDTLFTVLANLKQELLRIIPEVIDISDTVLPYHKVEVDGEGYSSFELFFENIPVGMAMAHLSRLKSDVTALGNYLLRRYIRDIFNKYDLLEVNLIESYELLGTIDSMPNPSSAKTFDEFPIAYSKQSKAALSVKGATHPYNLDRMRPGQFPAYKKRTSEEKVPDDSNNNAVQGYALIQSHSYKLRNPSKNYAGTLYRDYRNKLAIRFKNISPKNLIVKIVQNGQELGRDGELYVIDLANNYPWHYLDLEIIWKDPGTGELKRLEERTLEVLDYPFPLVHFQNSMGGLISSERFQKGTLPELVYDEHDGLQVIHEIKAFKVFRIGHNGVVQHVSWTLKDQINEQLVKVLSDAKLGDTYVFYDIEIGKGSIKERTEALVFNII